MPSGVESRAIVTMISPWAPHPSQLDTQGGFLVAEANGKAP